MYVFILQINIGISDDVCKYSHNFGVSIRPIRIYYNNTKYLLPFCFLYLLAAMNNMHDIHWSNILKNKRGINNKRIVFNYHNNNNNCNIHHTVRFFSLKLLLKIPQLNIYRHTLINDSAYKITVQNYNYSYNTSNNVVKHLKKYTILTTI